MKAKILIVLMFISFGLCNPLLAKGQFQVYENRLVPNFTLSTVLIPMRDGIHLATDIYLPNAIGAETRATILIRTPYDKSAAASIVSAFTTLRGYVTVVQDMRGRYASEGIDMVFLNASTDSYDTMEWITQQTWSNGLIGTYGGSALGINQFFMNLAQPTGLKAQAIQIATPNLYHDVMYQGGAFRESLVAGWLAGIGSSFRLPSIYANEDFTDYWANVTMNGKFNNVNAPGVFGAGWFDCFSQGTIDGFMGYQYESNNTIFDDSYVVIGPWGHGTFSSTTHGDMTFPINAIEDKYTSLMYDFFAHHLKQEQLGNYHLVTYYCMGPSVENATGNFWRTTDVWPVPTVDTSLYLRGDGTLRLLPPNVNINSSSYHYDPNDPVPTVGGNNLILPYGPLDQTSIESRDDVLIFTSDAFDQYHEVTGRMSAHLWVSSNCTDTDFTVKITDVYPDGRSILLQDGIVRAKYRTDQTTPDLLVPNEIVEVDIDLWSTSYIFNEGHKMRVAISSSNYPRFNANPNNGAPIFTDNQTYIANNTIYHDANHPSYITLPENINGTIPPTPTTTPPTFPFPSINWLEILAVQMFIAISYFVIRKINRKRNRI